MRTIMFLGTRGAASPAVAAALTGSARARTHHNSTLSLIVDTLNQQMPAGVSLELKGSLVEAKFDIYKTVMQDTDPVYARCAVEAAADTLTALGLPTAGEHLRSTIAPNLLAGKVAPFENLAAGAEPFPETEPPTFNSIGEAIAYMLGGRVDEESGPKEEPAEYYAVIPARAIRNAVRCTRSEALAMAEEAVRTDGLSGGHCGRPFAVVKVDQVAEPEEITKVASRALDDSDFAERVGIIS
jgi:hypothetical protein